MKEHVLSMGKWVVVGGLFVVVGFFVISGLGQRRGTRSYRLRLATWSMLVGLMGGGALLVSGCPESSGKKGSGVDATVTCYKDIHDKDAQAIDTQEQDIQDEDVQEKDTNYPLQDAIIMCYDPLPPDAE